MVNYSGFADAGYDELLDRAQTLPEPRARAASMRAAEARLMEQSPVLPIYYYVSKSLVAARVDGWFNNAANAHPSATLRWRS